MKRIIYKWSTADLEHMRAILSVTGRAWVARNQNGKLWAHKTKPFQGGAFEVSNWISGEVTCELCPDILKQITPGSLPVNIEVELMGVILFEKRVSKSIPNPHEELCAFKEIDAGAVNMKISRF